jgi:hypothetical protein
MGPFLFRARHIILNSLHSVTHKGGYVLIIHFSRQLSNVGQVTTNPVMDDCVVISSFDGIKSFSWACFVIASEYTFT